MADEFTGPHTTQWHERIATENEILRTQVGSGLHGVAIAGTDDRDEIGVCIEPPEYVIGLKRFEQYIFRTQPEGHRSGAGDLDLIVYGLRKFVTLAAAGNPTILMPLFAPEIDIVTMNDVGQELRARRELFLSRRAGERFLGYLRSQRAKMEGGSGHTNRPELVEMYGFDCYLDDTEFLTRRGWLAYDDIAADDFVATVDQATGKIEFQMPTHRSEAPYSGVILTSKTRYSEWAVTPNHRMRVAKMLRGPCGRNPRAYSQEQEGRWGFRTAADVMTLDWYQQVAAVPRQEDNAAISDFHLALVGAYVSEGSVCKRRKDGRASVLSFCQKDGGRLHETMQIVGEGYALRSYRYPDSRPVTIWTFADVDVADTVARECGVGSVNKMLPPWTLELSARQANLLLQSLLNGYGTPHYTGGWIYYTNSRKLAGDVQAVAILAGRRANMRGPYEAGMYQVLIHDPGDTPYATFRGRDIKSKDVDSARVVCFSVQNETLVTRRNGHVAMHGNSKHAYHALRLAIQGEELMSTGSIELPMAPAHREYLLDVRTGGHSKEQVIEQLNVRERALISATETSALPEAPDADAIDAWLVETYRGWWQRQGR